MARISRLIIYDSDDEDALAKQIEKSLPEGIHELAVKITIIKLADAAALKLALGEALRLSDELLEIRK